MRGSVVAVIGAVCLVIAGAWIHPAIGLGIVGFMLLVAGLFFDFGSER